jgi:hypothetical protein
VNLPDIIEFVTDPQLLNLTLSEAQATLLRAIYGLPLSPDQLDLFRACTGRQHAPAGGFGEVTVVAGARAGKDSRISAPIMCYEALFGGHERHLAKGERAMVPLIAQDLRATRIAFGYIRDYLTQSPLLASQISDLQTFELTLANGIHVACFPSTLRSVRGWSIPVAGLSEVAFFRLEGQANADVEIQASIRRGMIGFPQTRLVKISTPYMKSGVLHDDFTRSFGQEDPDLLVWRAGTALMNPTIKTERLEREKRLDPSRFAREFEAEFAEETDAFLPNAWVDDAVCRHRYELPPRNGVQYHAAVDPSGGGPDTFAMAVCHAEGSGTNARIVLDVVKGWSRQGVHSVDLTGVVADIAAVLKRYRVTRVIGDRYAGQWVPQAFASVGIGYKESSMDKSAAFTELEPLFAEGRIDLLDHLQLVKELKSLERRLRSGGRVLVDHPHGGHDDHATAVALAAVTCRQTRTSTLTAREILSAGEDREFDEEEEPSYGRGYRPGVLF